MDNDALANAAVQTVKQYLLRKNELGSTATYDAGLENLLGLLQVKLFDPYAAEVLARFEHHPAGAVETETLRLHLAREIGQDAAFRDQLVSAVGGRVGVKKKSRGLRIALVGIGMVGALVLGAVLAHVIGSSEAAPIPGPVPATTTTTSGTTTTTTTTTTSASPSSAADGDGGPLPKGATVPLTELPRPTEWVFAHGDHDVQFDQYSNSLWAELSSCNSSRLSRKQDFRLKDFNRFEAEAVGADSTSSPALSVKYEVFVNGDTVKPVTEVVVGPGEWKAMSAPLPPGTFALTLRVSLTTVDKSECKTATAVWGSPHVVAAGR